MATNQPTDRVLAAQSVGADLGDGFYVLPGMGNALVAETDDGLVLVDAGSQFTTPGMIELSAMPQNLHYMPFVTAMATWDITAKLICGLLTVKNAGKTLRVLSLMKTFYVDIADTKKH